MINTGLIGRGYWGRKIEAKLDLLSKKIFVQTSENYNPEYFKYVEWIFIATPVDTHYRIAKDCIQRGVNVFLEKPFCGCSKEAQELVYLAEANNVHLYIDNVFLQRSELSIKPKGEFKTLKFIWHKNGPFNDDLFNDLLYHDIYILISLVGYKEIDLVDFKICEYDTLTLILTVRLRGK